MRRPTSGHRKSQSSTALSAMAAPPPPTPKRKASVAPPPLEDVRTVDELMPHLDVVSSLLFLASSHQLRSIRSSSRRRLPALRQCQAALVSACSGVGMDIADFLSLKCRLQFETMDTDKQATNPSSPFSDGTPRHLPRGQKTPRFRLATT